MSLLARYKLEGNANDEGGTYNGSATSVTYATGRQGQCGVFNGSAKIAVNPATAFSITKLTAACWLKTSSPGASYRAVLQCEPKWGIYLVNSVLIAYDQGGGGNKSTGVNVADGNWRHIAYAFDSGVTNGSKLYINGVSVLTFTASLGGGGLLSLFIGGDQNNNQRINGSIDDVQIYNHVMTAGEVASLYSSYNSSLLLRRRRVA